MEDLIGQKINNFEIQELVGQGAMGVVYRAYHPQLQRYTAIKFLKPELVKRKDLYERFLQEARTASRLGHTNIVNVINFGEHDYSYYLMMDYIEGPSLRNLITENEGGLPHGVVAQIFSQIADVLLFAHEQGIYHRDLKPDNILLTESNDPAQPYTAMVTDFGLVKIASDSLVETMEGTTLGTPAYMSPEQCTGQEIDHRSDIYSFGVMLYEALTGKRPYPIRDLFDAVKFHTDGNFVAPRALVRSIPRKMNLLVRDLMAVDIDRRPPSAADIQRTLAQFLPKSMDKDRDTTQLIARIKEEIVLTGKGQDTRELDPQVPESRVTTRDVSKPLPYCIVVTYKGNVTRVYPPLIDGETLMVGRVQDADILLDSPERYVSKRHCSIEVRNGKVWLRDMGSTNGTYLDKERLNANQVYEWTEDEVINLGAFKLTLQYQGPKRPESTPLSSDADSTLIHSTYSVVCEGGIPSRLPLIGRPIVLGRLPDCDLVLSNTRVSKRHCRIEILSDETIEITDLDSTNGTFLDDRQLPAHQPVIWEKDIPLRVGDYTLYLDYS